MKSLLTLTLSFLSLVAVAQTEWTGPMITITKADFADWTLEENQDRITPNVWLTRANSRGLFNIAIEAEFDNNEYLSPLDTEWANGSLADGVENLTFDTYDESNDQANPQLGQNKVLHLITDDIYIDIVITEWTQGNGEGTPPGGGFTYMRSTDSSVEVNDISTEEALQLYPNPANDFIRVDGIEGNTNFIITNQLGAQVKSGVSSDNGSIDIRELSAGTYFLSFHNKQTTQFVVKR